MKLLYTLSRTQLRTPIIALGSLVLSGCNPTIYSLNTNSNATTTVTNTSSAASSTSNTATFVPASGTPYSSITIDLGSGFQSSNICYGKTIFGKTGTAICNFGILQSNMHRDKTTTQVSLLDEVTTYAGLALPTGYRDVPAIATDDDGYTGGSVTFATRPGSDCGTSGTLESRIANCASVNGTNATWEGASNGNAGQSTWKLVTRNGASKEVWRDLATGLLWSSRMTSSTNWCQASGNAESTDSSNYCNNVTYQPNYPNARSYCAETSTIPASASEAAGSTLGNSWSGTYVSAKGGMGLQSTPAIRWRLPTINDYKQAEIDGIRFVMSDPDTTNEWSATINSNSDGSAHRMLLTIGNWNTSARNTNLAVRCVGY